MDYVKENHLIFETLNAIIPIATAKVNMWSPEDRYAYPPFLRFRFKDVGRNDSIYTRLIKIVTQYDGNLKWIIRKGDDTPNYLLIPLIFDQHRVEGKFFDKHYWISVFTLNIYIAYIDIAVKDIPSLAEYIQTNMSSSSG